MPVCINNEESLQGALVEDTGNRIVNRNQQSTHAAHQDDADAQFNLAVQFEKGEGVKQSLKEAARLYKAAANLGHPTAQFNLANFYNHGKGVEKDLAEAAHFYMLASEQG